jgi:sigma-54 dependent transcriptional regulator, flagellar regulatory protein
MNGVFHDIHDSRKTFHRAPAAPASALYRMASGLDAIIGSSETVHAIRSLVQTIANAPTSVLILGESGTGKELVAQALHAASERAGGNFVPVNCAAIPKDLLESELFGHRKGSFTGALTDRTGRFELAHGGTLFLDEIGDMPLEMQVKLLRVLQERVIEPIGSSRQVRVDVRVVAATHRDIETEIGAGRFREDLYYRLNVLPVYLPPLRERAEDVPDLVAHFAKRHANGNSRPISLAPAFMRRLQDYHWPGNIRELSNLVARFTALMPGRRIDAGELPPSMLPKGLADLGQLAARAPAARGPVAAAAAPSVAAAVRIENATVDDPAALEALVGFLPDATPGAEPSDERSDVPADVPAEVSADGSTEGSTDSPAGRTDDGRRDVADILSLVHELHEFPEDGVPLKQRLADIERKLILQALERSQGNVSKTARLLNLQRTTLIEKLNKYDLRLP